jgi:hypothetical protein
MSNVATSLLDFILDLLSDPEAAADFQEDPEAALEDAGLGDLCAGDVDAILPMLADYAPVGIGGGSRNSGNDEDDENDDSTYGHKPAHGRNDDEDEDDDEDHGHHSDHGHKDDDDHDGYLAIEHIKHIQNHYTYSPTTTIDASHSVWGDSYKIWAEDDAVVAVNGAIAAGDDVEDSDIDNSVRDSYNEIDVEGDGNAVGRDNEVTNKDSFNTEIDLENVGNTHTQEGTGNVIGDDNDVDNDVDNSSVDVDIKDVNLALGDGSVAGSEDVNTANNSLGTVQDVEVDVDDSFNEDNSTNVDFDESFNEDDSTTVELDDSFNEENSVEIDESFNENAVAVDNALATVGDTTTELEG